MSPDWIVKLRSNVLFWVALAFSVFQISIAVFVPLIDLQLRALHVIFGITTALIAFPYKKEGKAGTLCAVIDLALIIFVLAACIHVFMNWQGSYASASSADVTVISYWDFFNPHIYI